MDEKIDLPKNFIEMTEEEKILFGLELNYKKLIENKRKTNGEIAIMVDKKVVRIKP